MRVADQVKAILTQASRDCDKITKREHKLTKPVAIALVGLAELRRKVK